MRNLDRDERLQLVVVSQINQTEPAPSQDLPDAVATDVLRLRSGSDIDGGLVVAARLVIGSNCGVIHGSGRPSRTTSVEVVALHVFIAARYFRSGMINADWLAIVMEVRLLELRVVQ